MMDRLTISTGDETVTLEVRDRIESDSDDNCDVHVVFDGGREFWTTCYTVSNLDTLFTRYRLSGENAHGLFIEVRGIIDGEMSLDAIRRAVESILAANDGELTDVFREVGRAPE